jgi:hypothetical protein
LHGSGKVIGCPTDTTNLWAADCLDAWWLNRDVWDSGALFAVVCRMHRSGAMMSQLMMLILRDVVQREYAYEQAQGLPEAKVGVSNALRGSKKMDRNVA